MPNQSQQILLEIRFVKFQSTDDNMFHTRDRHLMVEIMLKSTERK
jgi:hypothetical protein